MCRLFGLHAGADPVRATFWLLDAPDSLAEQSHRNPDGTGIGVFDAHGAPVVDKQPMAAWQDAAFATAARELTARTFVAHVRYATTGSRSNANTHPFEQDGRLLAHNGMVGGLDRLEGRLVELGVRGLVAGESDSERVFALITGETRRHGGDLGDGLRAAVGWIGAELPVFALNLVITTPDELWGLRYPDAHELWVLERVAGGVAGRIAGQVAGQVEGGLDGGVTAASGGPGHLDLRSARIRAHAADLAERPSVVLATERMDDDPGWRLLAPGELLRVGPDLSCGSSTPFDPPTHRLLP